MADLTWFPDDQHGYSIAICCCDEGPYLGARKMGTPCCCERCGFMTRDQFDFVFRAAQAQALRDAADVIESGTARFVNHNGPEPLTGRAFEAAWLRARADEIEPAP